MLPHIRCNGVPPCEWATDVSLWPTIWFTACVGGARACARTKGALACGEWHVCGEWRVCVATKCKSTAYHLWLDCNFSFKIFWRALINPCIAIVHSLLSTFSSNQEISMTELHHFNSCTASEIWRWMFWWRSVGLTIIASWEFALKPLYNWHMGSRLSLNTKL